MVGPFLMSVVYVEEPPPTQIAVIHAREPSIGAGCATARMSVLTAPMSLMVGLRLIAVECARERTRAVLAYVVVVTPYGLGVAGYKA
jgi:hypothetical protein